MLSLRGLRRVALWFLAGNNTMASCYQQVTPRYAVPGFWLRSPFIRGPPSRLLTISPGTHNYHGTVFLFFSYLTIAIFIVVLSRFWRFCRIFFQRCAWRARKSFGWTRGTMPTPTPCRFPLVWLNSFFPRIANESLTVLTLRYPRLPPALPLLLL